MQKVFISYSHHDKPQARRIMERLREKGIVVTIDEAALLAGESIQDFITRSIQENHFILSLVSRNSLNSGWVGWETTQGLFAEKLLGVHIIPVALDHHYRDWDVIDTTFEAIDRELKDLRARINKRKDYHQGTRDLESTERRLKNLRDHLDEIIEKLHNAYTVDIFDPHWEEGMTRLEERILPATPVKPTQPQKAPRKAFPEPEMIHVKGGELILGDDKSDFYWEKPAHRVRLDDFWIGKCPVTMEEYDRYCLAVGRELVKDEGWKRGTRPVIHVDWYDAVEYCNWLSQQLGLEDFYKIDPAPTDKTNLNQQDTKKWLVTPNWESKGYRLPTEAEWEYAARGGQQSKGYIYAGSNDPKQVARYEENSGKKTQLVEGLAHNELGIYDMSGNVWEWCWDWFEQDYYKRFRNKIAENPTGPQTGSSRVVRGGSWNCRPAYVRVAYRLYGTPDGRNFFIGLRLARTF